MKHISGRFVSFSFCFKLMGWTMFICVSLLTGTDEISAHFFNRLTPVGLGWAAEDTVVAQQWPHEQSDLPPDPALIFGKLPNGVRYIVMQNKTPLDRVSMHLMVHAGSLNETDDQQGLAHFLEHLVFCGSTHYKPGELITYFQSIGMDFGADANAHTGFSDTVYDMLLPNGSQKSLVDGLTVLRDFADGALLLPSEINRERHVVLAEKMTRDSASYRTFVSSLKFCLPDSLVSRRLPIGDENIVKAAGQTIIKKFYDAWYRPEKMMIVITGDMDPATAVPLIENTFRSLAARSSRLPDPDIGTVEHHGIKPFYHFEAEAGTASVSIEVFQQKKDQPDSIKLQKEEAVRDIGDRIIQNRLDAAIRKQGAPFTAASIHTGHFLENIYSAEISAESDPGNWKLSLAAIEQQLRSALEFGCSQSETERAKSDYLSTLSDLEKKSATRSSESLAEQLMESLEQNQVMQSPSQKKELLTSFVQSLTPGDILEALRTVWSPDHRLIELSGNIQLSGSSSNTSPENQILSVWEASQKTAVTPPVEYEPVVFPYLSVPDAPGAVHQRQDIADLGIVQVDFENGVRLNLKKTDYKQDQIVASMIFGDGNSSEPISKPGLSLLASEVVQESGLAGLTQEELERALAGTNTRINFTVAEDHFVFRATSVSEEIPLLFQLLYAHMVDPGFRQDACTLSMERYAQKYEELSRTVDGVAKLHAQRFLAGGDPRIGLPSYETFSKLNLDDVKSWLLPAMQQCPLEISIAGDMDVSQVIELASRYMGNLSKRSSCLSLAEPAVPRFPDGGKVTLQVDTDIPKSLVVVAYPTEDFWNIQRTRRLSVLAEVFSNRLRNSLRVKMGAAYSPAAFNHPSRAYPGYGIFQTILTVDIKDARNVIHEVQSVAASLCKKTIPSGELRRSLDPILTGIKDAVQTNDYWLNSVLTGSAGHPQQIEWSRSFQKDYSVISAGELHQLACRYLNNPKSAIIQIQPNHNPKPE